MTEKKRKKPVVPGCLMRDWNVPFPIEELKEYVNEGNVRDINDIDMGSSDNILLITSRKVSKRKAYDLFNTMMREHYGGSWNDVFPSD